MQISRKMTLVGIAVAVIMIFALFFMWKRRSTSQYTTTFVSTDPGASQTTFYANLTSCMNTFMNGQIASIAIHTSTTCTGTTVTVTTEAPHGFVVGSQIIVGGVSSGDGSGTTGFNTGTTPVAVATVPTPTTFTYTAIGGTCSGSVSVNTPGYSYLASQSGVVAADAVRASCVSSNVAAYMNVMCKFATYTTVNGTAQIYQPSTANGDSNAQMANYTTYTNNLTAIRSAYQSAILQLSATQTPLGTLHNARQADFTAATRNYLSLQCGSATVGAGYYATTLNGTTVDPAATAVTGDPLSPYQTYVNNTTLTQMPTGSGFNPSLVTPANILNWATYATGSSSAFTKPGTLYSGAANSTIAGFIGPGTVTSLGVLPGSKTAAGVTITGAVIPMNTS